MNLKHIKHILLKDELQRLENAIMNEQKQVLSLILSVNLQLK